MLTIFSVPRPFTGHMAIIQRNAIRSWTLLQPKCEIILCSDEPGVEEAAHEFGTKYIPDITRNEYGTPLMSSVLDKVYRVASHCLFCQVNADIILMSDFIEAVKRVHFKRFLMLGRRWNIELEEPWDFEQPNWEEQLRNYVADYGEFAGPEWIDYFVFPWDKDLFRQPPFVAGRPRWDNWFVYRARQLGMPVIDATKVTTVVHQNHGYTHVPYQRGDKSLGPEADRNLELANGHLFDLFDATHMMTSKHLSPAFSLRHIMRKCRRRYKIIDMLTKVFKYLGKPLPIPEEVLKEYNLDLEYLLKNSIIEKIIYRGHIYYKFNISKDALKNIHDATNILELYKSSELLQNKIRWILGIRRRR